MPKSVARVAVLFLLICPLAPAQTAEERRVWQDFVATCQSEQQVSPDKYRQHLIQGGMTEALADERMSLLHKLYEAYPALRTLVQPHRPMA